MAGKNNLLFALVLVLGLISCRTVQDVEAVHNRIELNQQNLSRLDGEYAVFCNRPFAASLDLAFTFKKYWWRDVAHRKSYSVLLHALSERRLQVTVMRGDSLVASKTVKYRIRNGDVYVHKIKFDFYFVLNVFGRMRSRISLLETGNLMVDHRNFQCAALVFWPLTGDRVNESGMEFRKLPARP